MNGIYLIKGTSKVDLIGIPAQIEHPEKLEQLLEEIMPIEVFSGNPFLAQLKSFLGVLILVPMGALYVSNNKVIVGVAGIFLILFFGYSFFEIRRSKNIDNRTKKIMWLMIFVVISIIGTMYSKLI